nr:MAG TPA: hypothetical protein [Caudoviricetes sp.]
MVVVRLYSCWRTYSLVIRCQRTTIQGKLIMYKL